MSGEFSELADFPIEVAEKKNQSKHGESYYVAEPPHIHIGITKNNLMRNTFIAMSILAGVAVLAMGVEALVSRQIQTDITDLIITGFIYDIAQVTH